ncbi:MAG: methionyl-tRNA formyltransferase [Burkholderiales bacterium]|nr:methionyl-tRNA formyltransferase [Burkholderiales bacterium]
MKIIFAGTPSFAAVALAALHAAGHQIELVLTQPDRPSGRGMRLNASAVGEQATRLGLKVAKPDSLKGDAIQTTLRALTPEVMVVAAYGLILPQAVLSIPKFGCINIHGSLLPRWRGAAPVQRAIEAGDVQTGIAIMQMDAGLDTGPVLLTRACPILPDDTSGSLFAKLTLIGAAAIVDAIEKLPLLHAVAQPAQGASYASKISKSEARIDWQQPAAEIEKRLRAFDPAPGCESNLVDESLKVWRATLNTEHYNAAALPGTVIDVTPNRLTVQCGVGALDLTMLQKPGGKRMAVADFLRGATIQTGWRFI